MKDFENLSKSQFQYLKSFLTQRTGIVIGENREIFFENRLFRFLLNHGIKNWDELIKIIHDNNRESVIKEMIPFLTTNKTSFFREKEHFLYLKNTYLPTISLKNEIYAWSGACSTGEELYTLAVILKEFYRKNGKDVSIRLLGTDIDNQVLNVARQGIYSKSKFGEDFVTENVHRYLLKGNNANSDKYKFSNDILEIAKFREFNLIDTKNYPGVKFDIIMLRNVLIYFEQKVVEKIVSAMANNLVDGGVLILGFSENININIKGMEYQGKSIYKKILRKAIVKNIVKDNDEVSWNKCGKKILSNEVNKKYNKTVLIVEDSKPLQKIIKRLIESNSSLNVVGIASDPIEAEALINTLRPDVITLDIKLPKMNGIDFLENIVPRLEHDVGVVVLSSYSRDDFNYCFRALEAGAFEYLEKPNARSYDNVSHHLINLLKEASPTKQLRRSIRIIPTKRVINSDRYNDNTIIAIGSSTGGVIALKEILSMFPSEIPPVVIVQHIPEMFSKKFADRLDKLFPFKVVQAVNGDKLENNTVYIAPGGRQLKVNSKNSNYFIAINDDPPMTGHRPSVNYFFKSLSECLISPENAYAIILTGMGTDGAEGLRELRDLGCNTIGQNQESCVVFGMPRAAISLDAVEYVEPLEKIPEKIFELIQKKGKRK